MPPLCFLLPWPHSTLPPELLPCCKSHQGAELVLKSVTLFWFVNYFSPLQWFVHHSAAAGQNPAGTSEITMWTGLGGEAEALLPDCSSAESTIELLSRSALCCYGGWLCQKPCQKGSHPIPIPIVVQIGIAKLKRLSVLTLLLQSALQSLAWKIKWKVCTWMRCYPLSLQEKTEIIETILHLLQCTNTWGHGIPTSLCFGDLMVGSGVLMSSTNQPLYRKGLSL